MISHNVTTERVESLSRMLDERMSRTHPGMLPLSVVGELRHVCLSLLSERTENARLRAELAARTGDTMKRKGPRG